MKKTLLTLSLFLFLFAQYTYAQYWDWAKSAGGPQKVESYAIAADMHGNSYITGWFEDSLKFGTTTLVASIAGNSFASDIFIAKYDVHGNLVWAKKAGGTNYDYGNGIAVDTSGNVYVTGLFIGTVSFGSLSITSITNDYDVFVAKYDANGNALWVNKVGGGAWDVGNGITLDKQGNCLITGAYRNTGTFGSTTITSAGNYDVFVAKYDSNGTFIWAKGVGGTGDDRAQAITTDATGNSYITGFFNGAFTMGTSNLTSNGGSDILLAKFDAAGNPLWGKKFGGIHDDVGNSIVLNPHGDIYTTGYYTDTATFDTTHVNGYGNKDAYVSKSDYKGDIIWVKKYGGTQDDEGYGISRDTFNNIYSTGSFWGTGNFDTITVMSTNQDDAYIAGIEAGTDKTKWTVNGGGLNIDVSRAIAASAYGGCFITGYFSNNATFGSNTVNGYSIADNDLFVARLDSTFLIDGVPIDAGVASLFMSVGDLAVFPNPFSSVITANLLNASEIKTVEMFDLLGKSVTNQLVVKEFRKGSEKQVISMDASKLAKGVYLLQINTADGVYSKRVIRVENN